MNVKLPKILNRTRISGIDNRDILFFKNVPNSKNPTYLSSTKSSSSRSIDKNKNESKSQKRTKRKRPHSSKPKKKKKTVNSNSFLPPALKEVDLSGNEDAFPQNESDGDEEFEEMKFEEKVEDEVEDDNFFLTELSHSKEEFKPTSDIVIDGKTLQELSKEREETMQELESYMNELKTKTIEDGTQLVEFPENYNQLIHFMANKGKEKMSDEEFSEYLKASSLSESQALEDITEENFNEESAKEKINKLDLIIEEKEGKLKEIISSKKKKSSSSSSSSSSTTTTTTAKTGKKKHKKLKFQERERVNEILNAIRSKKIEEDVFRIKGRDEMRLKEIEEELKRLRENTQQTEEKLHKTDLLEENEKEIKRIIESQIEQNI